MTERPILFSAEMVRAILAGRKTQTRRKMKVQPQGHYWETLPGYQLKHTEAVMANGKVAVKFRHTIPKNPSPDFENAWISCPYGAPGDLLWVRETFCAHWNAPPHDAPASHRVFTGSEMGPIRQKSGEYYQPQPSELMTVWYGAEGNKPFHMSWRPSIHMWRWASRITLRITDVRVERLQDITEDDARAEGVGYKNPGYLPGTKGNWIGSFAYLWNHIHGPGAWDDNHWVWALSFERVKP